MSGETEANTSGWTVDTLKYYVDAQIKAVVDRADMYHESREQSDAAAMDSQQKAVEVAFAAQQTAMHTALQSAEKAVSTAIAAAEKAVNKAEIAADKRFESVNEFRGQLADQAQQFVSKDEYTATQKSLTEKVDLLQRQQDSVAGRSTGLNAGWGYLIGGIGLLSAILAIAFTVIQRGT